MYSNFSTTEILLIAAEQGDVDTIDDLVKRGANLNVEDCLHQTPLLVAVRCGRLNVVEYLATNGANVNYINTAGRTPLVVATKWGFRGIVNLLLRRGAEVDLPSFNGTTALIEAAKEGHQGIIDILVSHNANLDLRETSKGFTALMCAIIFEKAKAVVKLIAKGADVNASNIEGDTALHIAARNKYLYIMELLLDNGAKADVINLKGEKPSDLLEREI